MRQILSISLRSKLSNVSHASEAQQLYLQIYRAPVTEGKIYNSTDPLIAVPHIKAFIETYSVNLEELAIQDPSGYATINEFFARRLKPGARVIDSAADPSVITSAADCRLTVWPTVDAAQRFWVKGRNFSIKSLFNNDEALAAQFGAKPSLAIFRLAPQVR